MTNASQSNNTMLSFDTVAARLEISKRGVYRLLAGDEEFPRPVKIGSSPRILESELNSYIETIKQRRLR